MTVGLERRQDRGDLHFVTFSCYKRRPYLGTPSSRELFERSLEAMRIRYEFFLTGYVVMPEHVHLLISEPTKATLATALQALKLSVSVQQLIRPFWTARYHDFNVYSPQKREEKLKYLHRNPVKRGLVSAPECWPFSSFVHYCSGVSGTVEIESDWTAARRERARP